MAPQRHMMLCACATAFLATAGAFAPSALVGVRTSAATTSKQSARRAPSRWAAKMDLAQSYTLDDKPIRGPMQPVSNYILVKLQERTSLTSGGVVLPDQTKERPTEGRVVAAGPGRYHPHTGELIPMCVAPGDRVMFSRFSGRKVKYQDEEHSMITDDDLLLVYTGDAVTVDSLKMVRDQVLVKIESKEVETDSGIVISATVAAKDLKAEGRVVAFGEGRTSSKGQLTPMPVARGDFVKFREYAGIDIVIAGENYSVCRMVDCLSKWQ